MKTINQWLSAYSSSHTHKTNILFHKFAVPSIVVSLFGMLWALPFPPIMPTPFLNWSTIIAIPIVIFYFSLSSTLAIGMIIIVSLQFILFNLVERYSTIALWQPMMAIFILAWILQFIGHSIEGKRPSFFEDLTFLLIGPLWALAALYKKLGIKIDSRS
jgi:uncharacterized membrane protein YGL010W